MKKNKKKYISEKPKARQKPRIELCDLEKAISKEYISLTEGIIYFGNGGQEKRNFFIYWTMDGRKTIFESGNILLVDDEGSGEYFRQAFERKYDSIIPKTKHYNSLIDTQVERYRNI